MRKIIVFLFSILFISCATSNIPGLADYQIAESTNQTYPFDEIGNIIIKRDNGFMGSALSAIIFINKEKLVKLYPGNYYKIKLENGDYFLSLESAEGVNLGTAFSRSLRITINNQDEKRTFRVFPMPTQGILLEEILE